MESLAQKKAKANFKKAIAYRKKTGCSLKEAFAHVQGKKVGAVKKRSSSPLKKKVAKKAVKKTAKKAISTHKDTNSHNVNIRVVSGFNKDHFEKLIKITKDIEKLEFDLPYIKKRKIELVKKFGITKYNSEIKRLKNLLSELKKHKSELKKLI